MIAITSTPTHILVFPPASFRPCVIFAAFMVPPIANRVNAARPPASDQGSGLHIIVHNDSHDPRRQRGNLAHELAHLLLGHPFTYPIDPSGCRNVDRDIEDDASWLGPTILVSNEAALHIVRQGFDEDTACEMYGVSLPLLRMRINGSGARIRHRRSYY